jgi:tRNA U34 2-thiouridine synthase MnmA/TrmU
MPLLTETTKRKHRIGREPVDVNIKNYSFPVADLSKDLVRELARDARMVNYSQRSKQEMIDFINAQGPFPLQKVQLKIIRSLNP